MAGVKIEMKHIKSIWTSTVIMAFSLATWGLTGAALQASPAPGPQGESVNQAATGEITGKVLFEGTKPHLPRIDMSKDPECAREQRGNAVSPPDGRVNSNDTLPSVFVFAQSGAGKHRFPTPTRAVSLDQKGCVYVPHVLGIMVGQPLEVVNSDFTTHNIHVMSKDNPSWNQSQPPGGAPFYKKFEHPEIMIAVHCNEHPWMKAYIGVVRNPLYAVTGKQGTFTIKGIPAGEYTFEAWTPTFGTQKKTVTVQAGKSTTVDFTFRNQ